MPRFPDLEGLLKLMSAGTRAPRERRPNFRTYVAKAVAKQPHSAEFVRLTACRRLPFLSYYGLYVGGDAGGEQIRMEGRACLPSVITGPVTLVQAALLGTDSD